jgi:NAD(P)H-hydrate epimerase
MEKVAGLLSQRIQTLYQFGSIRRVGVIVGPGHNGGDALVVARELWLSGYEVVVYQPLSKQKDLTAAHAQYAKSLNIPFVDEIEPLKSCDLLIDGLFGFGLTRSITDDLAEAIAQINHVSVPIISIDLPSGLHTDTGEVLGIAIRADYTLCLGLWKLAFLQDRALEYIGQAELIDFGLPLADIHAVLGGEPTLHRITAQQAIASLPLPRHLDTHKYKHGHLLLVCGSQRYMGAAILTSLAARSSGVGMLSVAVPECMISLVLTQVPEGLVIGCPQDTNGAIAHLPSSVDLSQFSAIACGPGLTPHAISVVQQMLESDRPLVLDADGLNILATLDMVSALAPRSAPTVLTPHPGEFRRLFPEIAETTRDRTQSARTAAQKCGAIVLLKGARVAIAHPNGTVWFNPDSTPALARGGTGDVLTGLLGGLMAQASSMDRAIASVVQTATWWHAQAGILAAQQRTELGVDALTLTQFLIPALAEIQF